MPNPITDTTSGAAGLMTLSANGRDLVVPGYDVASGGTINTSSSSKVVAAITPSGIVDTTTAFTTTNPIRGVASVDGSAFWTSGSSSGVQYVTLGGTTATQISATGSGKTTNNRAIEIYGGQLYADGSTGTGPLYGPGTVGSGIPTTGSQAETQLNGFPTTSGSNAYQFAFANASTLYLADASVTNTGVATNAGGIQKWTLSSGTWSLAYSSLMPANGSVGDLGLVGLTLGLDGTIYGVTGTASGAAAAGNRLMKIVDTGTGFNISTLATATSTQIFHGVALSPSIPTPSVTAVTVNPTGIVSGTPITLTATVTENLGTPTSVSFYREATAGTENPATDTLVPGTATNSAGTWTLSGVSTTGLTNGAYTYYAVASDSTNGTTSSASPTATLNVGVPTIGSVTISPVTDPVAQPTTLTALNVTAASVSDPIASVKFYEQVGSSPAPATDKLLGSGTASGSSYSLSYTPTSTPLGAGAYTIYAVATANSGLTSAATASATKLTVTTPIIAFSKTTTATTGGTVVLTVTRSGDIVDPVTINYATADGTATTAANNYTAASGTLNFPAYDGSTNLTQATTQTITVTTNQLPTQIGDKDFTVALSGAAPTVDGIVVAAATATETVIINQTPRAFTAGDVVIDRGGNGVTALSTTNGADIVYLDEYSPTGSLVQSFPLPTSASGSNHR
jgi:hypothetical protein